MFSNGEKVQIPWLPLTNLHERLMEASNTYAYCATATSSYLKGISLRIKKEKNFIKNRASLETLNSFLSLMPALGDVGLRVLGICTSEVDVSDKYVSILYLLGSLL